MNKPEILTTDIDEFGPETIALVAGFSTIREPHIKLLSDYLDIKANMDDSNETLRSKAGAQYVIDTLINISTLQEASSIQNPNSISMEIN